MCEKELNQHSTFAAFIRCWCEKNADLDAETRQQRAYYWSWQHSNWFSTLLYLSPEPVHPTTLLERKQWWTWDPTPTNAHEAGVDVATWQQSLDPATEPWKQYQDVCRQFSSAEDTSALLLRELSNIMGINVVPRREPSQQVLEEQKLSCAICSDEIGNPALFNLLREDYRQFAQKNVKADDEKTILEYQIFHGGLPQIQGVSFDATRPTTALFIREMAAKTDISFEQAKHDVLLFLSNPQIEKGPVVHTVCQNSYHTYHDQCIRYWYRTQRANYMSQLEGAGLFAPLASASSASSFPNNNSKNIQFGPFTCPLCKTQVTSVLLPPATKPILLGTNAGAGAGVDYSLQPTQRNAHEWGPYRLRQGALVWFYTVGTSPGSEYSGTLGILKDFKSSSVSLTESFCEYGGCFSISPILPRSASPMTDVDVPVAAVFDVSFLEYDLLPTRNAVSEVFTPPLGINLVNYTNSPYYITENVGLFDLEKSHGKEKQQWKTKIEFIRDTLGDGEFSARLQELLDLHRARTESALAAASSAQPPHRLNAETLLQKMLTLMGYYESIPPRRLHFRKIVSPQDFVSSLQNLTLNHPALQNLRVSPSAIFVFLAYASAGYDILPEYSAVLLPVLRERFPVLPTVLEPLRSSGEKRVMWPPPPKSRKRESSSSFSSSKKEKKPRPKKEKKKKEESPKQKKPRLTKSVLVENIHILMDATRFLERDAVDYARAIDIMEGYLATLGIDLRATLLRSIDVGVRNEITERLINVLLGL